MTRLLQRPTPAAHLSGSDKNRPLLFDDVNAFDGMPAGWRPGRPAAELRHDAIPGVLAELRAQDPQPVRTVLGPVGRVRLDRLKQIRREQTPVAQQCAAAGLVYAKRHLAAEVRAAAPDTSWAVRREQLANAVKAGC